jgi:hypothetical protein
MRTVTREWAVRKPLDMPRTERFVALFGFTLTPLPDRTYAVAEAAHT